MDKCWEIIKFVDADYWQCRDAVKTSPQEALPYVMETYPFYASRIISIYMDVAKYADQERLTHEFLDSVIDFSTVSYANLLCEYPECYHEDLFIKAARKYSNFISCNMTLRFIKGYAGIDDIVHQMIEESLPTMIQPRYFLSALYSFNLDRFISDDLVIRIMRQSDAHDNHTKSILDIYSCENHMRMSMRMHYEFARYFVIGIWRRKFSRKRGAD